MAVTDPDWLVQQFEASRPRLRAVAHRMLGSRVEADDAVQETWLKLARADTDGVDNLAGWLTTVLARVCLDRLRATRSRPEEPATTILDTASARSTNVDPGPEGEALLAESVGSALLVVLDLLAPAERVAFVLHDIFAVPFDTVGEIVGRSPDAARQLASRARRRVQGTPATANVDIAGHREVVDAFLRAARGGDYDALVRLLDPGVVMRPDEAAARLGALAPVQGAAAVAAALSGRVRSVRPALVDGLAGLAWMPGGRFRGAIAFTISNGRIAAIDMIGDPERLRQLDVVPITQ